MRLPIQYACSYPDRWDALLPSLDLARAGQLEFFTPDSERFPCLGLAYRALRTGGTLPVVLNAANEIAVHAFLNCRLTFTGIPAVIEDVLDHLGSHRVHDFEALYVTDSEARALAGELIEGVPAS